MKTAPQSLAGLARLILSEGCQSITLLTGAGVSVAADIPDFRSPGGMYDTLRPELLTATPRQQSLMRMDPTYVVAWDIFQDNAFPYLEVRRPFILGVREQKWKATIAHRFVELLHTKTNKIQRLYTQNIDGLHQQCQQIPDEKIIPVHGTLSKVQCEGCASNDMDFDSFCDLVQTQIKDIYGQDPKAPATSTPIKCTKCHKPLVKPQTVLFGRSLPPAFFQNCRTDLAQTDLLIVAGTSLVVSPANSLVQMTGGIRVVINRDLVGEDLGMFQDSRDYFAAGNCDDVFLDLIVELGWLSDLYAQLDGLAPKSAALVRKRMEQEQGDSS